MWASGLQVAVARKPDKLWVLSLIKEINASHCGLTRVYLSGTSRDSFYYLLLSSTSSLS